MYIYEIYETGKENLKASNLDLPLTSHSYSQIRELAEMGYLVTGLDINGNWAIERVEVLDGVK